MFWDFELQVNVTRAGIRLAKVLHLIESIEKIQNIKNFLEM